MVSNIMDVRTVRMNLKHITLNKRSEPRGYIVLHKRSETRLHTILFNLYNILEKTKLGKENRSETGSGLWTLIINGQVGTFWDNGSILF